MRILILVVYYLPSTSSAAKLISDLALELAKGGHDVTVLAPDHTAKADLQCDHDDKIRVVRVRTGEIKNVSKFLRGYREISLSGILWKRAKSFFNENSFDLIIYYSPTIFFGPLVKRLKGLFGCPAYLILRDIFPQWAFDAGIVRRGLLYRLLKHFEKINYDAADIIGIQSPANKLYFSERGLDQKYRIEVLYNWMSPRDHDSSSGQFREKLGLDGKVIFFYGGNIGVAQDIDNLVRVATRLQDVPEAYFLLVGEGSEVPRLKREIQRLGLKNFVIHPAVEQRDYLRMIADIDIGMISLDRNLKTHNYPGKMLGYMYHAKPILASINPGNDLQAILQTHKAGLVCHNGDDDVLYNQCLQLIKNASLRVQMGMNGRNLLEDTFSTSTAASQILSHFSN
ncbi:MAG: glycosyltransferase family 4 protein [Deltaproteobacteria bacterium]|nr:glycosyltransferase family 4 protein [Deltaproteobacteria bacterium]